MMAAHQVVLLRQLIHVTIQMVNQYVYLFVGMVLLLLLKSAMIVIWSMEMVVTNNAKWKVIILVTIVMQITHQFVHPSAEMEYSREKLITQRNVMMAILMTTMVVIIHARLNLIKALYVVVN